jgi:hypothetical protein
MATRDIFNFEDQDLVNLQGWLKRKPREFTKAVGSMLNTVAGSTRQHAISNIKSKTTTRASKFVDNSLRVQKVGRGVRLDRLEAQTYSFDISKDGRSTGFQELEEGAQYRGHRVPTMTSRGGGKGRKSSKVAGPVRMNKRSSMLSRKMFKSSKAKSKRQQTAAMLAHIRKTSDKTPFIIDRSGLGGSRMANMEPGVWRRKSKKNIALMNPFDGQRGRTKRIRWMQRAAETVTSTPALKRLWSKEIDKVLKRR